MAWLILLIGMVVGAFSGVVGIGGGMLFGPVLVWLLGMDQYEAQGTSLGELHAPVGIQAFLEYHRKGHADLRVALLLAMGFTLGDTLARWPRWTFQRYGCAASLPRHRLPLADGCSSSNRIDPYRPGAIAPRW